MSMSDAIIWQVVEENYANIPEDTECLFADKFADKFDDNIGYQYFVGMFKVEMPDDCDDEDAEPAKLFVDAATLDEYEASSVNITHFCVLNKPD